ncbi:MFS transporter [Sporosarcina sp. ACRSM]|uniref:MFS transporter n=1 Tax=Sporosarcina sp. ACRSM TaxID=2918216 RepID=UPI001EF71C02|nr:MFS transporter [Sporosarcina sp. ACRSM]MCG7337221.1 MFS transporter [Sporosarcina sp. ACRSM]
MNVKKQPFIKYENGIIIIMFMVFGLLFMDRLSIIYLFPFIAPELGLNNTQLGMLVGATSITWGISTLIFASLSDFIGKKKNILITFIIIFSLATFTSGLVGGLISLLLVRLLMGAAEGPVVPLVQSTIMVESTPSRRGMNMGFIQSAAPLMGNALAPIIVIAIAVSFNWRYSLYALAIPGIILALVLIFYMREPIVKAAKGAEERTSKLTFDDYKSVFKTRNVWISMLIAIFYMMYLLIFSSFMPTFLTGVSNYTEQQYGIIMVVFGVGMFFWQLVIPFLSDKIGRKTVMIPCTFIAILLPLAVANFHSNMVLLAVLIFLLTIGFGCQPLYLAVIPSESVKIAFAATAISSVVLTGEIIGGTLGPVLAGVLADKYSLYAPLWLSSATAVLFFLLVFALKESAPVKLKKRGEANLVPEERIEFS